MCKDSGMVQRKSVFHIGLVLWDATDHVTAFLTNQTAGGGWLATEY